ncbi:hypothetical protein GOODEAATRI_016905 [Goodea atripinnis]|uniref:Uncharacterized protein n=1 Tax=Goodea atripinnis TaxID=208336 RepID=A0ABV0NB45_9TELE
MEFLREMPENSHLLCEPYLLLKCVFLGPSLDNSPSSDSERTYLWSPSKDPPHSFLSVAPRTTPCLSTLLHQLLDETIVTHRAFLDLPTSASTDAHASLVHKSNLGLQRLP